MLEDPPPLSPARLRAAIAAALMTILLGALDQTIVSVAVPTIAHQLGGFGWLAWVVSGYMIASAVSTPLYGSFSDSYGRRRVMQVAIGIFVLGSVACALAQSLPQLVIARVLQGLGGGGLIAMAQAVVADVVPLRERGRYQGYISITWALASIAGPLVGGVLTQYLSWPWIFWINLPLGFVAAVLVTTSLPRQAGGTRSARFDGPGVALLVVGLVALLVTVTRVGQGVALLAPATGAGFALAALALTAFWAWERRTAHPILPIALLRQGAVARGCAMLFLSFFLFIALATLVPLRLQLVGGASAAAAAVRLLPLSLGIPLGAYVCGRYIHATGRLAPLQRLGAVLVPPALLGLALVPAEASAADALLLAVLGFGFGCQLPTTLLMVQNSVPRAWLGTATALTAFFRQLGGAVGIAVLSAVLLALLGELPGGGAGGVEGLAGLAGHAGGVDDRAFRLTFAVGAVLSLVGLYLVRGLPDIRLEARAAPAAAD